MMTPEGKIAVQKTKLYILLEKYGYLDCFPGLLRVYFP